MSATLTSQCWCTAKFCDVPTPYVLAGRTESCGAPWCRPGVVSFTFTKPGRLMSMNDRDHWAVDMKLKKAWRHAAFIGARVAKVKPQPRSLVSCVLPTQRPNIRRDPSNYFKTLKHILDGCVDARVWPDDTPEYVVTSEPTFKTAGDVIIWIERLP